MITVNDMRIAIYHGSPESNSEHLFSTTAEKRFKQLADLADADIVVFGHSHEPFQKTVGKTLFINTGSVGRPDDGDPRATAAIMEIGQSVKVNHLKIEYDINKAIEAIRQRNLPENFTRMIHQGRSLDWILENE
jgi:predicted phosphodiesterase